MAGNDCVVFCIEKKVPDKMIVADSVSHMHILSESINACMVGLEPDALALVYRLRQEAADFRHKNGFACPVHVLANRAGDMAQVYTQKAFMRPYAVLSLMGAVDDECGPSLYKVDPAGMFQGYKAAAAGVKEQEAMNFLEKQWKKHNGNFDRLQAIELAIDCLQTVTSLEFKPTDVEVCVLTQETGPVQLSPEEIDARLNAIADRD